MSRRADIRAGAVAVTLVAVAAAAGGLLYLAGGPVRASSAPLFAHWLPHAGPGTPLAVLLAGLIVWRGPAVAATLRWRLLLPAAYLASAGWILALALVDGWRRGLTERLTTPYEYLSDVDRVIDVPATLRTFTDGIVSGWTTHVAGHPPGALLVFVGLDRIGLGGGAWAGLLCILGSAAVAVAVPVTLRSLCDEAAARAAVPFVVLFPGAVWMGVSADGLFAGVVAAGLAMLAAGRSAWAAAGAGVVLALGIFLSYGLVLIGILALAVAILARRWSLVLWTVAGAAVVIAGFAAAGFWWLDGYHLVKERYYAGLASARPYGYWVWANLAALVLCAGPASAVVTRRAVRAVAARRRSAATPDAAEALDGAAPRETSGGAAAHEDSSGAAPRDARRGEAHRDAAPGGAAIRTAPVGLRGVAADTATGTARRAVVAARARRAAAAVIGHPAARARVVLPLAALVAIVIADLSGLSKAETERIWLPFAVWLPAGAALLPSGDRRGWLAVQAGTALLINHLLLTSW